MKHAHLTTLAIACASVLLAGCQMNVITEIEASGAGTLTTEVGMTPDEVAQLESLGDETGDGACSAFSSGQMGTADAPAFEQEMRGEETWCVAVMPFEDLNELEALYREMEFVQIRELALREDLLVYDLELDAQGSDEAMAAGETAWVLVLPGKLGSHNADSVEGKRLTWTLEPNTVTEVQASSDLFAPGLPFNLGGTEALIIGGLACACGGGALLLVVVVVFLLLRRKRSGTEPGEDRGQQPA